MKTPHDYSEDYILPRPLLGFGFIVIIIGILTLMFFGVVYLTGLGVSETAILLLKIVIPIGLVLVAVQIFNNEFRNPISHSKKVGDKT